jgi:hypothetical protein
VRNGRLGRLRDAQWRIYSDNYALFGILTAIAIFEAVGMQ